MRRLVAPALAAAALAGGCALVADLPDWEMGSADASIDAEGTDAAAPDAAPDAGEDATPEAGADAEAGCPFGCPVLAFDCDEGAGTTANDRSGHGNAGTLVNGTAWDAGVVGSALAFDGVDDGVEVDASASLDIATSAISILFWAKVDGTKTSSDDVILGKGWAPGVMSAPYYQYGVEFSASSNKSFDFFITDTGGGGKGPLRMVPSLDVWTHVAFTYDGATMRGYLDGVQKQTMAATGALASRPATHVRLGTDEASLQHYKGLLDDVRIYDRALSAAEIVAVKEEH